MTALQPFAAGDIFLPGSDLDKSARFPTGKGKILQFASDWSPKAVFETGQSGLISALCLDNEHNLHALDPQARTITSIGADGALKTMFERLPTRAYGSMIALPDGTFLIGEHMVGAIPGFSGDGKVYHANASGEVLAEYDTETNGGVGGFLGVTHMALSDDRNTLYHTSETGGHVYAHDLATNARMGPVYSRADPPPMVFGIAAPGGSDLIVAGGNVVRRIGLVSDFIQTYDLPEARGWAVPVMRRNRAQFWALDFFSGKLACVDVETGAVSVTQETGLAKCLTGIAEMPA